MAKRRTKSPAKPSTNNASGTHASPMDVALLERLVKLMAANDLNTVDLRDGERRVVLKRGATVAASKAAFGASTPQSHPAGGDAGGGFASAGAISAGTATEADKSFLAIKSPMVGTFYAAPSQDAPPFVTVGSEIEEDSDVCIIEAMKVFNNIKAECRGTIERVLVTNGQTVEFGQVLFLVKPV